MFDFFDDLVALASKIGSITQVTGKDEYIGITVLDRKGKVYDFCVSVRVDKNA